MTKGRIQAVGAVVALVLLAGYASTLVSYRISEARSLRSFAVVCRLNNIVKADNRWRVRSAVTAFGSPAKYRAARAREDDLLPILDCAATFANGARAVPLAPSQDARYVETVGGGRIPIVKDGQVVGSRPPESGPVADF